VTEVLLRSSARSAHEQKVAERDSIIPNILVFFGQTQSTTACVDYSSITFACVYSNVGCLYNGYFNDDMSCLRSLPPLNKYLLHFGLNVITHCGDQLFGNRLIMHRSTRELTTSSPCSVSRDEHRICCLDCENGHG